MGIIVLAEDIGLDFGNDNILLWESDTPTPPMDVIKGVSKSGPMLVKFSERLDYNFKNGEDSKCSIRHLYTKRDADFNQRFKTLIPSYNFV